MRQFLAALLVVGGLAAYPGGAVYADVAVPPLQARVTDLTGTLNAQQKSELESRIAAFESKRGSQIAVLMLPTTKPEEIEQYAIRVAEAWKIGRKKVDDGLILVIAKDDRRLRIEVGYGLEGAIPDSAAKRVIDERITPRFRNGDFYGGVRDGVDQLIKLAEGEKLPSPPPPPPAAANTGPEPISFLRYFAGNPMFIFILTLVGGAILKGMLGRFPGSLAIAAGIGLLVLLMYGIGIAILAAFAAFIVTFTNTGGSRGAWSSGSSGGSSWGGGSSSSGGGFSGGGGSFGGGGASGRW